MVEITPLSPSSNDSNTNNATVPDSVPSAASQERFLDAEEIESLLQYVQRPSVKVHLQTLITKIRKDGQALQRVEVSRQQVEANENENDVKKKKSTAVPASVSAPAPAPMAIPTTHMVSTGSTNTTIKYKTIDRFSFDAGSYNSSHVTVYISLPGIGQHSKDLIHCKFTKESFDLTIDDFKGTHYRLLKDNLDKDIDPNTSKIMIKADKIMIKLGKVKNEYGYDSWMDLTSKKSKESKKQMEKDPQASIMNLMKEMYESGDDNMRKMIGETMMKQREGKLDKPDFSKGMEDF